MFPWHVCGCRALHPASQLGRIHKHCFQDVLCRLGQPGIKTIRTALHTGGEDSDSPFVSGSTSKPVPAQEMKDDISAISDSGVASGFMLQAESPLCIAAIRQNAVCCAPEYLPRLVVCWPERTAVATGPCPAGRACAL